MCGGGGGGRVVGTRARGYKTSTIVGILACMSGKNNILGLIEP